MGTVRRPPRGVPKAQIAKRDFYDLWFPNLAPSPKLLQLAHETPLRDDRSWKRFERGFHAEMKLPDAARVLDLLAALSHHTSFSIGCYCEKEERCHRSILRQLLSERGADLV